MANRDAGWVALEARLIGIGGVKVVAMPEPHRHLDASKTLGGHCESRDAQERLWDFTFQPMADEGDGGRDD